MPGCQGRHRFFITDKKYEKANALRELYGAALDIVARHSQVISVLVELVNQVEQPLTQHLVLKLLCCAHHIERRPLIIRRDGVE